MDSNRNTRSLTLIETLKPVGYEALCNLDAAILVMCSLGLWLSSVPHIVHSLRMIQDTSNKDPFFRQPSSISEYLNGSFDSFIYHQGARPVTATFLYAKWDADSKASRSIVESTNQFSPLELFAVDCWTGTCSKTVKIKRYPELRIYYKDSEPVSYQGSFDQLHIANFFSRVLRPMVFISSEIELSKLLLQYKLVVLGRFHNRTVKSPAYKVFYQSALRFLQSGVFKDGLDFSGINTERDILFAVANFPKNNNSTSRNSSSVRMSITIFISCINSELTYDLDPNRITPDRLTTLIMNAVTLAKPNLGCHTYPTDITPTSNRRSTALSSILSSNPVLLLVGPHLSLIDGAGAEMYMLHSLRVSYNSCNDTHVGEFSNQSLGTWTKSIVPKGPDAHKLLHTAASSAQQRRTKLSLVCPSWLNYTASNLHTSPVHMCGIPDAEPVVSMINTDSSRNTERVPLIRAISKLSNLLQNSSTRSAISRVAVTLLQQLYSESGLVADRAPSVLDDAAILEHLQFTCCRWLHLRERIDASVSRAPDVDGPSLLLNMAAKNDGIPPPNEVDRLACASNRTLQFHVLDSWLQPTLAWELAGFDELAQSKRLGAAIVDQEAEAVYRLEETVTYESLSKFVAGFHAGRLKPWRRHPRPSLTTRTTSDHPNLISIGQAHQLNELLDSRTRIHSVEWSGPEVNASLVLLYYSRACALSTHGDSLMWHFESVARNFASNPTVTFARVDVSAVELPWHLRVERIPSVIFFPAHRSTYSSVFPLTTDIDDLSVSLTQFIQTQSEDRPVVYPVSQTSPKVFSLRAREALLSALTPPSEQVQGLSIDHIHKHCDAHPAVKVRAMCRGGVRLAINAHQSRLAHAQMTAAVLIRQLQRRLIDINDQLTSPSHRIYAPARHMKRLSLSLQVHSELWAVVRSYENAILITQKFLSPAGRGNL